jgi:abhydrolase domain-containing protein 17
MQLNVTGWRFFFKKFSCITLFFLFLYLFFVSVLLLLWLVNQCVCPIIENMNTERQGSGVTAHLLHLTWVVVQAILIMWGGLALFAVLFAPSMLYQPPHPQYKNSPSLLSLETSEGDTIKAVYKKRRGAKFTVIISHGNAEDLGTLAFLIDDFYKKGYSVMAYDYPGYGHSSGKASERSTYAAADAVYQYLLQHKVRAKQILVFGRSMGSGMAYYMAAKYPVAGMIVEGGFISAFRVMTHVALLPFDYYDNLPLVAAIRCPVLLIHARDDEVVAYRHAQVMKKAFGKQAQLYTVSGAHHNTVIAASGKAYWSHIQRWLHVQILQKTAT